MKTSNYYKPLIKDDSKIVYFNFTKLAAITTALPLTAFIFCILWSLVFNFTESTSTHCHVANYLPSISAAVGSYSPQKYVWKICIGLHSMPRYLVAYMYYYLITGSLIIFLLNIIEISCLIGLTFISSTENFEIHALSFVFFTIAGSIGMILLTNYSLYESRKVKSLIKLTNLISIGSAVFFYLRHNWFCESGVYTMFALSEYIVVLTNMAFHFQAYYDFQEYDLLLVNRLTLTQAP